MRVATLNIWNNDYFFSERLGAICKEIEKMNLDIIALQEVRSLHSTNFIVAEYIVSNTKFKYYNFRQYHNENEGMLILSKHPIYNTIANWDKENNIDNCPALVSELKVNGVKIAYCNIHLDYKSIINRERQIVKICNWIDTSFDVDFYIICGDFNSDENSSVYKYLTGKQSLFESETLWHDLALINSSINKVPIEPTLDFISNTRWNNEHTLETPKYCDWILLKTNDNYTGSIPKIISSGLFGKNKIEADNQSINISDHYGLYVEMKW